MTKKDRVIAAIKKEQVDSVPSGFSLHFPSQSAFGEKGVQAHLAFFKETDTDICKIMNEHLVPACGSFASAQDYRKIPTISGNASFIQDQIVFTQKIMEKADPNAFMLGTLHGVLASSIHPLEKSGMSYEQTRTFLVNALREDSRPVLDAMKRITDGMCELALQYRSAGMDGIYYAALGAEKRYFTDEEFAQWIAPFDYQILKAIKESGAYSFLHMCKDGLDLARYTGCLDMVDVVNWGVYEAPYSLEEGRSLFSGKTIMGGLPNRTGVLVDGSQKEIQDSVKAIIHKMGRTGFILGSDCTLATEQDLGRVRFAVEACRR
ncbi:uroporphyrinogen decarboxylase family protein [uncultured Sphaerochaeta sp.]|uniref:uroporphyrinogen decarboxylase family protein n=1 Tax=uncultured Sphaerochaeta sp. TaxID=886478 RepID=UPI002A0A9FC0|nr:uroporphyrinogen decarboxylase family protein [uncultured Sphaerochaeta sp.]